MALDARSIVENWKLKVAALTDDVVQFSSNSRYHGRLHIAYFMSSAEYVSIRDDDIEVGPDWVRYCITISESTNDALIGANGRSIVTLMNEENNDRFASQKELDGKNDCRQFWTIKNGT